MTGLKVTKPDKLEYQVGEALNLEGFKVEALYDSGDSRDVTEEAEITGFDSDTPGEKTIVVSYGGLEERFTVTVTQTEDPTAPGGSDEDPSIPGGSDEDPTAPGGSDEDPTTPGGSDEDPTVPGGSGKDPAAPGGSDKDPVVPGDADGSRTPSVSDGENTAVQTGDETSFGMYVVLLAAAGAAMGIVVKKRKTTE